jgi:Putative auto-transporter adhesin, head GIN domain
VRQTTLKQGLFALNFDNTKSTTMKKFLVLTMFITVLISSCRFVEGERIKGNGVTKTESRIAGTFNSIHVSGNVDVYVKQDSLVSIRIEADENLIPYILTENSDGTLRIHQKERTNLKTSNPIKVYVSGPSFKRFKASGACNFFSDNMITNAEPIVIDLSGASNVRLELKAPGVKADLSGAGTITLKGETKDLRIDGSGSTNVKCFEMMAENTYIDLSGAGTAEVFASVKLDVQVAGAADVRYKGNATVSQSVSGAGSVKKVE